MCIRDSYNVDIADSAIDEIIKSAKGYIHDNPFPTCALELMDI